MDNIDFPFHVDQRGRTAQLGGGEANGQAGGETIGEPGGKTGATGRDKHIRNMIEQFLFTNMGERLNRPDFGSGLLQLIFAPNSSELAATLQFTVQSGLQRWLGDIIEIQALAVTSQDSTLRVSLQYLVRRTQELRLETFERSAS